MDLNLQNRIALIGGASGGIGAATAKLFAEEGCDVVVTYHQNGEGAEQTAEQVRLAGRQAWLSQMDIADAASVQAAIGLLPPAARHIDILVMCAGEAPVSQFSELTSDEWQRVVELNLNGSFYLLQACRPLLQQGASVVFVASVAGQTGVPLQAHYAAAKAGMINLTKSAARALAPHIRVNCVAPGMTLTDMGRRTAAGLPPDYAQQKLLLERFAEPIEIARCIVFLASPSASFVTGATLDVNGGRNLR
ncbi:MAG: SDR family NAD(P)-dependent oxidoreductase [Pirellulaceae bacterium]|nr:SDR family oxidoreductase [Planctomycetales bacterium]